MNSILNSFTICHHHHYHHQILIINCRRAISGNYSNPLTTLYYSIPHTRNDETISTDFKTKKTKKKTKTVKTTKRNKQEMEKGRKVGGSITYLKYRRKRRQTK